MCCLQALLAHHVDAGLTEAGHFISPALLSVPEDVQAAVDKVADLDMSFSLRAHSYPDRITSVHTSPLTPQVTGSIKRASPLSSSPRDAASTPAVPSLVLPDASSGLHQFADEPSEVELSGWEFLRELQTPDLWFLPPALQEFATAAPSAPRRSPPQSTLAASEGSPTEPASAHKSVARGSILPSIGASAPGRGIFVRAPSPISDPAASAGGTLPSPRVNRLSFPSITPVLQTRVTLDLVADAVPVARAFVGTAQPRKAGVGALRQQPPRQSRASSAALADASSAPRLHPRGSLVAADGRRGNRKSLSAISR